jgi:transcriptional regulator with XRE-family HTH domain
MHTIGQKLEEARKRLGLSVREAAEATKIRGDILLRFESSDFNFDLPEVYKRGFLRLYARLLKLDTTEIMREYANLSGETSRQERQRISHQTLKRELFGQIALDEEEEALATAEDQPVTDSELPNQTVKTTPYKKIALFGGIGLLAVLVLIWAISGEKDTEGTGTALSTPSPTAANPKIPAGQAEETITLIASGDVYVVVRQELDRQKLFVGSLKNGERVSISKKGPIKIQHTQGENLMLEKDGQRYAMSASGLAVSQFN